MTRFISTSCAFLATALMATVSLGCGESGGGDTGYTAAEQMMETSPGECNAIVATALSAAQECYRSECAPGSDACNEVTGAFGGFFGDEVCAAAFAAGELNGLPGNASIQPAGPDTGAAKHIGEVICSGVFQCGLCPIAPEGVCTAACAD